MKRLCVAVVLILSVSAVAPWTRLSSSWAQPTAGGLPGARPTIAAEAFASLQAALDALPQEGGLVRLPAGTFEITEPLRIRSEDVSLVGAGTAFF